MPSRIEHLGGEYEKNVTHYESSGHAHDPCTMSQIRSLLNRIDSMKAENSSLRASLNLFDLDNVLAVAKAAVSKAAPVVRAAWAGGVGRSSIEHTKANATDLVTHTDKQVEAMIIAEIRTSFPNHCIIGEETSGASYDLTNEPTWTIDPIDGTTNFVHRFPWTCILISFIVNKEVKVAVTLDPVHQDLFWAVKGRGSWMKNAEFEGQIRTSGTTKVAESVVGI
jgi:fructose-1,6-bisphosphatase/inositol monophosphatase family enzyme